MKNIVFVGFPCAGKTTAGRILAAQQHLSFVDLDDAIEEHYHITIPQLIQKYGESVFRTLEFAALKEVLNENNAVIAVGGGTPCHEKAMDLINTHARSIYLKLNENEIVDHLLHSKKKRPLTNHLSESELREYVKKNLAIREPYYLQAQKILTLENIESQLLTVNG